ncbi:MAG: phenylacetate--CoA ligase family protein [Pricia sp.]|nr:phenylacetate--CoA ligase family protein [Pricia sp.]
MKTTLRNALFWISDWLKGSKVRRHFDSIRKIHQDHESEYSKRVRKEYVSEILKHCSHTVPYYRNLGINNISLEQFPVLDKNLIKENYSSFLSDIYLNKETFKATTSGSTGTPFTVLHNKDKKRRHTADVRYFWEAVGHAFGTRFYYLRIWTNQNRKSKIVQKRQNIVPVDVFKLDDKSIQAFLEDVGSTNSPKSILGYASVLDRIVKYTQQHPIDMSNANVVSIIAMSESLDIPTKNALIDIFDCPVVSRYANTECGMLAQQTSKFQDDFLANFASYHIEILELHTNTPVKEGKIGRIIVTDLFNRAMPLIRYDTGDLGRLDTSKNNGKTHFVFKKVEGRKMDTIYDTKGEPISSFTLTNNMWKYSELSQYQFIQVSKHEYIFKLNVPGKFSREQELVKEFTGYLGKDATIHIEYVDEIPLLSSGKRKKVLNKFTLQGEKEKKIID